MPQRILVIEDEEGVLKNTLEILAQEGFEVCGAGNGERGVALAQEFEPDLIICDIAMPTMNGYEVLTRLRHDPRTALTPFIFLTARTERTDMRRGMNLGADDYVTKPFTVQELIESVRARLDRKVTIRRYTEGELNTLRENMLLALPHELRTPLTSIMGFADMLVMDGATMKPEQVAKLADRISKASARLYRLIENYLAYAQIEIIRLDAERLETLQGSVTIGAAAVIEAQAIRTADGYGRAGDLHADLQDATLAVREDYLAKIVEELIDNACKFSEPGSPIGLYGASDYDGYSLQIRDAGRGMTRDQIARVGAYMQFERDFYEQQGSGMGLIIAWRLAEMHRGEFWIDSALGQGTTVTMRVPMVS